MPATPIKKSADAIEWYIFLSEKKKAADIRKNATIAKNKRTMVMAMYLMSPKCMLAKVEIKAVNKKTEKIDTMWGL